MTALEKANDRLAAAMRAQLIREPSTTAERTAATLEAALRRSRRRAYLSEADLAIARLTDAERTRRRRAKMTEGQHERERASDRARKRARRGSEEYAAQSPADRWRERGRRGLPPRERPFVGVDGEGGYVHDPWCTLADLRWCGCRQYYAALTVGDCTLRNPNGQPLTPWQCLEFLTAQPKDCRYVGYFFDYDSTHILRGLPARATSGILHPERDLTPHDSLMTFVRDPVSGHLYGIRYIPRKLLSVVRAGDPVTDEHGHLQFHKPKKGRPRVIRQNGRKIEIHDCAGYWQTSFLQALTTWEIGTSKERATIQQWKAQRNEFTLPLPDDVVAYNVLECRLLAKLMTRLDSVAEGLGIHQTAYFGAGALAEALLDKHNVARYLGDPASRCDELVHAINCAYFGGRFESAVVGIVPELHVWDIASAYPAAMASLPCLRDGSWVYHDRVRRLDALSPATMVYVCWDVMPAAERPFGPLPYRCDNGALLYPLSGEGWYWVEELRAAVGYSGCDGFTFGGAWEWQQTCDHQPFAWVPGLYEERQALGKNSTGMVLKYAMNSLYGKMAQTSGDGGRYTEFVWAGLITARTRARLLEVAGLAGEDAVMFATDGVGMVRMPSALSILATYTHKAPLGAWEYSPEYGGLRRNVLMVQSGFYIEGEQASLPMAPTTSWLHGTGLVVWAFGRLP